MRDVLPGALWARGGSYKRIKDRSHQRFTLNYIAFKQEPGSVVWTFKHGFFLLLGPKRRRALRRDEMR